MNAPASWIKETSLRIGIGVEDSGSGVQSIECDKQGSGHFEVCGSEEIVYDSLVENQNYVLVAKAKDKAGNPSESKQILWALDQTPPTLTLSTGPSSLTANTTPDFSFIPIDRGSGVVRLECRLDSQVQFSPCQFQFSLSDLSDGSHTIKVRAVDNVGWVSQLVSHSWRQDATVPTIHFTEKPPALTREQRAVFRFSGINNNQGIVSYKCRLDGGNFETCQNPRILTGLSEGQHSFSVVGLDSANNESQPITYVWLIDRNKPSLTLLEKPEAVTRSNQARFVFQARSQGSGIKEIQCKIDNGAYGVCSSPKLLNNLSEGNHTLMARSVDRAGNFSDVVSYQWTVDQTNPTMRITSKPENLTGSRNASFSFTAEDSGSGIERIECRLDGRAFETCQSPKIFSNLLEGDHTFSVRARDRADNPSSVETHNWSVIITFTYYVGRPHIFIPKGDGRHLEGAFNVVKINENLFRGYVANATTYLFEGTSLQDMEFQGVDKKVIGERSVDYNFYCSESNAEEAPSWQIRSRDCGTWLRYTEKYRDYIRGWAHVETNCCYSSNGQTYASVAYVESYDNGKIFHYASDSPNWPFFPQSSFPPEPRKFRGLEQISLVNARGYLWAYMSVRHSNVRTVFRVSNDDRAKDRIHWKKWFNGSWQDINNSTIQSQFSDYGAREHGIYPGYDVKNDRFILVGLPLGDPRIRKGILLSTSNNGVNFKALNTPLVPKDPNTREEPDRFENFRSVSIVSKEGGNRYGDDTFLLYYTYQEPGDNKHQRNFVYREIHQVRKNSVHEPTVKLLLSSYEKNGDSWTTTTVPSSNSGYRFVDDIGYILTEEKNGSIPLYDCSIKNSQPVQHINRSGGCEQNENKIRTLGYIYPPNITDTQGLIKLYQCYDEQKRTYLAGIEDICNGNQIRQNSKIHLGYIY